MIAELPLIRSRQVTNSKTIQAIAVSPGIAIGRVLRLVSRARMSEPELRKIRSDEVDAELARFHAALESTRRQLKALQEELRLKLNSRDAGIFEAQRMLVEDRTLLDEIEKFICDEHLGVECAIYRAVEHFTRVFGAIADEYLQERAADLRDVTARIMQNLDDVELAAPGIDDRRIIVAPTLTPSETAQLDRSKVLGFAVAAGSTTSHTAILARSMQLPAVVGVPGELIDRLSAADTVIIDGYSGKLIVNPDARTVESYKLKIAATGKFLRELARERALLPETADGFLIELAANLDSPRDYSEVEKSGAHGVGLLRTEFLFMEPTHIPDEDEQFEMYRRLLITAGDKPVTIRTFDIGGDKLSAGIYRAVEQNPFLGLRGIRLCLHERLDLFKMQLRALLRAGVYGNLRVMLPMISSVREVIDSKLLIEELRSELLREKRECVSKLVLGAMVETPAAALMADKLARQVDFLSIGTNDLAQYTMAIDRGNERVAHLYQPSHPAILKLIRNCVVAANAANIHVGVCGQMAGDPVMTALLVGLGVHELSMVPAAVAVVRRVIRGLSFYEAEEAAMAALECTHAAEALAYSTRLLKLCSPEIAEIQPAEAAVR